MPSGRASGHEPNGQDAGVGAGMTLKDCQSCHKTFKAIHSWNKTCSRACGVKIRRGKTALQPRIQVPCINCGTSMLVSRKRLLGKDKQPRTILYCSKKCRSDHLRIRYAGTQNPNYRNAGWRICIGCRKRYKHYNKARKYCGFACSVPAATPEALVNGRRGLDAERECRLMLVADGYAVTRSAASKGAFDLIAVSSERILFIQVKCTKIKARAFYPAIIKALQETRVPLSPVCVRQIWARVDRDGWYVRTIGEAGERRIEFSRQVTVEKVLDGDPTGD